MHCRNKYMQARKGGFSVFESAVTTLQLLVSVQNRHGAPLLIAVSLLMQAKGLRRHCGCCGVNYATQVTWDDALAPSCPAFWCSECYTALHYDAEGRLIAAHRVFPYHSG